MRLGPSTEQGSGTGSIKLTNVNKSPVTETRGYLSPSGRLFGLASWTRKFLPTCGREFSSSGRS